MAEELGRRETDFAIKRPELERRRKAAIVAAQAALAAYEKELAPELAEQERKKAEATAKLEADLKAYETTTLAKKMADWEKEKAAVGRQPLGRARAQDHERHQPVGLDQGTRRLDHRLGTQQERGRDGRGRDRADRDHRAAARGAHRQPPAQQGPRPGDRRQLRAQRDRLSTAAPKADPKQAKPVKLDKAVADFSQDDFDVANAIDGSPNDPGKGWAVSPATGTTHWATFETAQPIGGAGGTVLTFKLTHMFQNVWTLGRFRLSATRGAKPVGLSLPEDFRAILAVAPELRTEAQKRPAVLFPGHEPRAADQVRRGDRRARRRCRSIPSSRSCATRSNTPSGRSRSTRHSWPCAATWRSASSSPSPGGSPPPRTSPGPSSIARRFCLTIDQRRSRGFVVHVLARRSNPDSPGRQHRTRESSNMAIRIPRGESDAIIESIEKALQVLSARSSLRRDRLLSPELRVRPDPGHRSRFRRHEPGRQA